MRQPSLIALGSLLTVSAIASAFAGGCGNGDDDDNPGADAGTDSSTLADATSSPDGEPPPDAGKLDGSTDAGDSSVGDGGHDGGADASDAAPIDAGPLASFHTIGRWEASTDGKTMSASWPGSGLTVAFTGTSLVLNVKDTAATGGSAFTGGDQIKVFIDTADVTKAKSYAVTGTTVSIGGTLAAGTHTATIYKTTDANVGTLTIDVSAGVSGSPFSFSNATDAIVPSGDTFAHKIEFIGDEQTAGFGDGAGCDGMPTTNPSVTNSDETLAYPGIVSRFYNAEHVTAAEYQMSVVEDNSGATDGTAALLWPLVNPYGGTDTTAWTFSKFTPDAVVVNLGAITDFGATTPDSETAFESALTGFLTTVYTTYNKTPYILVLIGAEYSGDEPTTQSWTEKALAAFKTANTANGAAPNADYVLATDYATTGAAANGCGNYPSGTEQAAMALNVESKITAALKWTGN